MTFLSILAVLNNTVVWMVSTDPPTSKSSRPLNNPLVTVPKAPISISIIVTFMFHSFFNSLARSRYLAFFSQSFSFFCGQLGQQNRQFCKFSFLLLNRGSLSATKPSVCKLIFMRASCLQLTLGTWLYYCLTSTCFRCSSAYLHRCIS